MDQKHPWSKQPKYFQRCRIHYGAALSMLNHTQSSSTHQVMGLFMGRIQGDCFLVTESFWLPVESTETRVNAGQQCEEFMIQKTEMLEQLGRTDNCVGWYHSHPGFGCWLSGIDVATQQNYQKINDPWLAIVIDPLKTKADGELAIGAFRTHDSPKQTCKEPEGIAQQKMAQWGYHYHKYYSLEVQIVERQVIRPFLDFLEMSNPLTKKDRKCETALERLTKSVQDKTQKWLAKRIIYR